MQVVLKSQILAGGRGLGSFTNGLKGGVHICKAEEAPALAAKMLGATLVTKQVGQACIYFVAGWVGGVCARACACARMVWWRTHTQFIPKPALGRTLPIHPPICQTGAAGKPVNTLYVANKMQLKREMYFAILLDRSTAGPIMIGCRWVAGLGS